MGAVSRRSVVCALTALIGLAANVSADPLLNVGDYCVAIDLDSPGSNSSYPAAEGPVKVIDGVSTSKYLNFGRANSGFIVTPASGASIVQSMVLTTANDHQERDPASYALYGTNDPITSLNNSVGMAENWTLIAEGGLALPEGRGVVTAPVNITNATAYTSYKLLFPQLKSMVAADSMQVAEVQFYTLADAGGTAILAPGNPILAVNGTVQYGSHTAAEAAPNAINRATTGYRNAGKENSGLIVTPWVGPTIVTSLQLTTGPSTPEQDPTAWVLYGTNDPITSTDNSTGGAENWTLIASDVVALDTFRNTPGAVQPIANGTAYTSYKLIFPSVREPGTAVACQIGEVQFEGTILSTLPLALLAPADPIVAIDLNGNGVSSSSTPTAEVAANAIDGLVTTKYLNFGEDDSGIIFTPASGSSTARSMVLSTADDSPERDPASFILYGTNDAVISTNNSLGNLESWTFIASGALALPDDRKVPGPYVAFANEVAYTSYKLVFPTVKNGALANSMQVSEIALYASSDATGTSILASGGTAIAIDLDEGGTSSSPAGEGVTNAINGLLSKYLNSGNANSGFIVTPAIGATNVSSFRIVSGNDFPARDPSAWALYGTNDAIRSASNSTGRKENWTLISSGSVELPLARNCTTPLITFTNYAVYTSYRMVFTDLRELPNAGSMQIAEIQFYGQVGLPCPIPFADADSDGDVDLADYGLFQECLTGANGGPFAPDCRCFDTGERDGDIDLEDLGRFMDCFTGPSVKWTAQLAPDCVPL